MLVSVSEMLAKIPTINPAKKEFRLEIISGEKREEWRKKLKQRTYEKRSTSFRNDVNLFATENVTENEG